MQAMKIKRERLAEIIVQEVKLRLRELAEADEADDEDDPEESGSRRRGGEKPQTTSADQDAPPEGDATDSPGSAVGSPSVAKDGPEDAQSTDADPGGPSVDGNQPDPDAIDADGHGGAEPSGDVNNDVSGKTVQAISIEPKSKILPGAKEVVVTFNETTDELRVLITSEGTVEFHWRGQLYDMP